MLHRFHGLPSAMGRMLTIVVAAIAGAKGFSFVFEVLYHASDDTLPSAPDALISMVRNGGTV